MFRRINLVMCLSGCLLLSPVLLSAQDKPKTKKTVPSMKQDSKKADSAKSSTSSSIRSAGFKLAHLAAEDSVFFMASNGRSKADPNSKNKTEQLWAEQSVQDFFQQLGAEFHKLIQRN